MDEEGGKIAGQKVASRKLEGRTAGLRQYAFIAIVLLANAALIIFTNQFTLQNNQNSGDEQSYLLQAQIFASGRLSVPSHPMREFFTLYHTIDDGKFHSKYPPGWPLLLTPFVLLGLPMAANLVFSLLATLATYLIGREFFSETAGRISAILMATSPYMVMFSASYYSQPAALFFTALATYLYLKYSGRHGSMHLALCGIACGILFNIRPFDGAIVFALFAGHLLWGYIRHGNKIPEIIKKTFIISAGFLALAAVMLLYNYLQTQDPLLMPFVKYDPNDRLGFNTGSGYSPGNSVGWAIENNIFGRLLSLAIWTPLFALLLTFLPGAQQRPKKLALILSVAAAFFAGYFFWATPQFNSFGDRYMYPACFAIILGAGACIASAANRRLLLRAAIFAALALNICVLIFYSSAWHERAMSKTEMYRQVGKAGISNAVVFLQASPAGYCSGDSPCADLTRNGPDFSGSVLFALDRGWDNPRLMAYYPGKQYYLWACGQIDIGYSRALDFTYTKNTGCGLQRIFPQNYAR